MTEIDTLRRVPLFSAVSTRDLKHLRKQLREETFNAGQDLVTEGDAGGRMFVITEGRVKIIVGNRTRRVDGPGAVVGELSIFDRGPRMATVRAETRVEALAISSTTLLALIEEQPSMTRAILRTMATRLRECEKALSS